MANVNKKVQASSGKKTKDSSVKKKTIENKKSTAKVSMVTMATKKGVGETKKKIPMQRKGKKSTKPTLDAAKKKKENFSQVARKKSSKAVNTQKTIKSRNEKSKKFAQKMNNEKKKRGIFTRVKARLERYSYYGQTAEGAKNTGKWTQRVTSGILMLANATSQVFGGGPVIDPPGAKSISESAGALGEAMAPCIAREIGNTMVNKKVKKRKN